MDGYAINGSHYFSPDHINVTLYFLCGVHDCTKRINVRDIQTYVMKGTAGRHSVVINMVSTVVPTRDPANDDSNRKYIFANVSNVIIEELTINNISVDFEGSGCRLYGKKVSFSGPIGPTLPLISVINITGYHALFDACTFQHNTFVRLQSGAELAIKDSEFHSYNHVDHSAISGFDGCTVILSGVVSFANNTVDSSTNTYVTCGGVMFLAPAASIVNSDKCCGLVLNVSQDANIHFTNNTADCGGALCLASTKMNVGSRANLILHQNKVREYRYIIMNDSMYYYYFFGGAILAVMCDITIGESTNIQISSNIAHYSGGIYLWRNSSLIVYRNAVIKSVNNTAYSLGGAIFLEQSHLSITDAVLQFQNNTAVEAGGAISLHGSSINITEHANVTFVNNVATLQAGAVYQSIAGYISIDVYSCLEFYNNSAGQGGALYLTSPGRLIVGHNQR